ncbi:hypothetical protein SprV_0301354400 [Sparganum proliferum]
MVSLKCKKTALLSDPSCRSKDLAIETIELLLQRKYDEMENRLGQAQVLELLKFCLRTYFTFDGTIYEQVKGTPMGSPISGFIAEAVRLAGFLHHRPKFCARYVDDTFDVIDRDQLLTFKEHVNAVFTDIQFTMEEEVNNQLVFLDVLEKNRHQLKEIIQQPEVVVHPKASPGRPPLSTTEAYDDFIERQRVDPCQSLSKNRWVFSVDVFEEVVADENVDPGVVMSFPADILVSKVRRPLTEAYKYKVAMSHLQPIVEKLKSCGSQRLELLREVDAFADRIMNAPSGSLQESLVDSPSQPNGDEMEVDTSDEVVRCQIREEDLPRYILFSFTGDFGKVGRLPARMRLCVFSPPVMVPPVEKSSLSSSLGRIINSDSLRR